MKPSRPKSSGPPKLTHLSYDAWVSRYRPVKNMIDPNAAYDGCMFETFGNEVKFVQTIEAQRIWTLLDCDGKLLIVEGFHYVNRLGYFVTELPAPIDHNFSVSV